MNRGRGRGRDPIQLKFTVTAGNPKLALQRLGRYFGLKKVRFIHSFVANYGKNILVFKFASDNEKQKVNQIESLESDLKKISIKLGLPSAPNTNNSDRRPRDPEWCDVFVHNLNEAYFYCFTKEERDD